MTLLEHIEKIGIIYNENSVEITCLIHGKGIIYEIGDSLVYPIKAKFDKVEAAYTEERRYVDDAIYPSIALGHYDGQLACALAIKEQNFDMR